MSLEQINHKMDIAWKQLEDAVRYRDVETAFSRMKWILVLDKELVDEVEQRMLPVIE